MRRPLTMVAILVAVGCRDGCARRAPVAASPAAPHAAATPPGPAAAPAVAAPAAAPAGPAAPATPAADAAPRGPDRRTTLYTFKFRRGEDLVEVSPGMVLEVLGGSGSALHVRLPDGTEEDIPEGLVTDDAGEVAVALAAAEARAASDPAVAAAVREKGWAEHSSARLAPLLDGKAPRDAVCGPPQPNEDTERPPRPAGPAGLEVLGIADDDDNRYDDPEVAAPSVHDARVLADRYGPVATGFPLSPALRAEMASQAVAAAMTTGEALMGDIHPHAVFALPARERRGAYYLATTAGLTRIPDAEVHLEGRIDVAADLDGCETGPRRLAVRVRLDRRDKRAGVVVWFPAAIEVASVLAQDVSSWKVPPAAWGKGWKATVDIQVADVAGARHAYELVVEHPSDDAPADAPVLAALAVKLASTGVELLIVATHGNPACGAGYYVYAMGDALTRLGGTDFGCDV